jgi:predicted RNA-binding Zn ribbon-like protein
MTKTARYRVPGGREGLRRPQDLGCWFQAAGLIDEPPPVRPDELDLARRLREATYRLVHPNLRDDPRPEDVDVLNRVAAHAGLRRILGDDARSVRTRPEHAARSCLAEVAADAIELLSGPLLADVRECVQPSCSLIFLDTSRGRRRRWCDMTRCGNRSKAARHRLRVGDKPDQP